MLWLPNLNIKPLPVDKLCDILDKDLNPEHF
jgi:hypothetical protein